MSVTTAIPRPRRTTGFYVTVSLLGFLVLVGIVAAVWRFALGLGATTGLSDGVPWGIWIGLDFSLIALSGTGFTMATVVHVLRLKKLRPALRPAVIAGLVGYASVLVLLIIDLGRPDRFYHFLIYPNLHSPLFEISWCVLLYTMVLFIETSPFLFEKIGVKKLAGWVHKAVIPISVIGLVLSSLHQSTLGTLYLNMPHRLDSLWYGPIMSVLFFVSSIMAGFAVAMISYSIASRIRGRKPNPEVMSGLAKGVAWTALAYLVLKLADMLLAGEMGAFFSFDRSSVLMWLEIGLGVFIPMVMFFIPTGAVLPLVLFNIRSAGDDKRVRWIGASLVVMGVLLNRFNATLFGQTARVGASYSPHILEWLSTIGVLGGMVLAWYLGIRYLAIFEGDAVEA